MKLRRLLDMNLREVAGRSRQEAAKLWDRYGLGRARRATPPAEAPRLDEFWAGLGGRFFVGVAGDATAQLVIREMLAHYEDTLATAEAIVARRFDLLGHRGLDFGDPIDWHLDPVSGRRAPVVHWSRLDPLDAESVGDSKVVWELNRQQWLARLGQAYRLTGDERYAAAFADDVRAWMDANPRGIGINWASSLEVALRLVSWCWALALFRGSAVVTPALFARLLADVHAHATHVETYLSHYFAPNTHLTGEALGLFYAGTLFPELRAARRWRATGMRILLQQLDRQVHADGVYFEQSTCYQRYTIEIYLHFMLLAARNGVTIPGTVAIRLQQMLDVLLALRRPDGSVPSIGDADGGWLLPLATRGPDDARGLFSTGAVLFGRSDYAWAAGELAPETAWLLGAAAPAAFARVPSAPPSAPASRAFRAGGLVVMRSGWDPDAHQLILDAGPLGCRVSGGHGHADLLSIQASVFGRPCLVDAGTYGYTAEPDWRDFFRGTAAHSTVMIDGTGQATPAGHFKWRARPRARLARWLSAERVDYADASHDAYRRLTHPVVHRRRVLFVKPRYWVLIDDLDGSAEHRVDLRFQFAPIEVTVDATLWTRARVAGDAGLFVRPFAAVPLKGEVYEGDLDPRQGWVAPDYGRRLPAPLVSYSTVTPLPLRIVTLLLPTSDVAGKPPAVPPLLADAVSAAGLVLHDGLTDVYVTTD